jgi:hypothetical protein
MKLLPAIIIFFVAAFSVRAQTVANTSNVLHPILKDPSKRNAPTSLDQDPSVSAEFRASSPTRPATLPGAQPIAPAKPAEIVAKIDSSLAASTISLIGTVNGIKGRFYVTNIGSGMVVPLAQFAVCNEKGFQIGSTAKTGGPLAPNDAEKIEVLATNFNAVSLKLMKLTADTEKK